MQRNQSPYTMLGGIVKGVVAVEHNLVVAQKAP